MQRMIDGVKWSMIQTWKRWQIDDDATLANGR